jgi:hypothetical protein
VLLAFSSNVVLTKSANKAVQTYERHGEGQEPCFRKIWWPNVSISLDSEKNFTDISSMQQSTARLSLLGLPAEIRLKIWEYVLGNQTIHIIIPGTIRGQRRKGFPVDRVAGVWRHTLCVAEVSYEAAYVLPIWSERSGEPPLILI